MKYLLTSIAVLLLCQGCYQSMGSKEEIHPPEEIDKGDEPESIVDLDTDFEEETDSETELPTDTDTGEPLNWITVPGGSFDMGNAEWGSYSSQPIHTVNVPTFDMAESETTVAQYALCVDAGACSQPHSDGLCSPSEKGNWNAPGFESHPVNCVDWLQATDFCEWAGGRLPSESEWEYAARSAGQDIMHPWGDDPLSCVYAVVCSNVTLGMDPGCGTGRTGPACTKPLGDSDQGLCSLMGNVSEWVQDSFHSDYEGAPNDGSAWTTESEPLTSYRVKRGGSFWNASCGNARSRSAAHEDFFQSQLGFRCAR